MSVIRRDLGLKDTGIFIIGRGDVIDRVDKLIFVAPIFYYRLLISHSGVRMKKWNYENEQWVNLPGHLKHLPLFTRQFDLTSWFFDSFGRST